MLYATNTSARLRKGVCHLFLIGVDEEAVLAFAAVMMLIAIYFWLWNLAAQPSVVIMMLTL